MKQIAIIWAWAAGLMAAATILEWSSPWQGGMKGGSVLMKEEGDFLMPHPEPANQHSHIHLFDKNTSPGKKVLISGGGRCNVTTGIEDKRILETKYVRGWHFIKKSMGKFSPRKCREWFESHGVPMKCESDNRVFPVSDDGADIVWVFEDIFEKYRDRISLHYGEGVREVSQISLFWIERNEMKNPNLDIDGSFVHSGWQNPKYRIITPRWSYEVDVLVITTGGNAYSHTGSTGDGYAFARVLGHTVTKLGPSLSSFLTSEKWLHNLSGLSFEDARVSFSRHSEERRIQNPKIRDPSQTQDDQAISRQELNWPLLLTHFGISWPLAFMTSAHLAWEDIGKWKEKIVYVAPIWDMTRDIWDQFLKNEFQNHPKKLPYSILCDKLPKRFVEWFISEYFPHIKETFASSISRKDREQIASLLGEGLPLTLLERRPGDEFVTAGWVSTDEIDPETMESRLHKNLYFAWEVLNVDGYTGGFSLQICWASGWAAGKDVVKKLAEGGKNI